MTSQSSFGWCSLKMLCCLMGGHASTLVFFSYGVMLNYMFSYMHHYDYTVTLRLVHMQVPILTIVGSTLGWLHGYLNRWVSDRVLHLVNVINMIGCCLVIFWFCHNFTVVTMCMAAIGLSYGMLHCYFLATTVTGIDR
jgi:hypothetical protein